MIDHLLEFHVLDLIDADGRPCGEVGSRQSGMAERVLTTCPHAGARHGGMMNAAALRQVTHTWPVLLATLRSLVPERATVSDAFRASIVCTAAPWWHHVHWAQQPVPREVSALFKANLGFSQVLCALLLTADGVADEPLACLGSPEDFMRYLDQERWLVGQVQVCAGSDAMISQCFEALCGQPLEWDESLSIFPRPAAWMDLVTEMSCIQTAYVFAVTACQARGEATQGVQGHRWLDTAASPWLRIATARPHATGHARRLLPSGSTLSLSPMIEAAQHGLTDVERVFQAAKSDWCERLYRGTVKLDH